MSGKRSPKASSSSSPKKRKKKRRSVTEETQVKAKAKAKVQGTLAGFSKKKTKDIVDVESLKHLNTGKRLLLSADSLYDDDPPEGEENYMFLYTVQKIYAASNTITRQRLYWISKTEQLKMAVMNSLAMQMWKQKRRTLIPN